LVTTIVGWVPEALADEVDAWAFDSFLPTRFGSGSFRQAVQLRIGQPVARDDRVRRHWQLVRYLCRSLDPALQVRTEGGREALVDCLGVPRRLREPQGRPPVVQTWRVSRTIGEDARRKAAREKLPLLSALHDRAWSHLATGWELDEHRDRCRWAAEREAARRDVELSWPSAGGDLGDRQRDAKMAELEASWPDDPHMRERTWLGWWNIGIRSHSRRG
jgi:hypothetical protein